MSAKQTAADVAFKAWIDKSIWRNDRHLPSAVWLAFAAGFAARGLADIAAVEAALEGGVYPDEDWQGYKAACERIEGDIRALDEDVK